MMEHSNMLYVMPMLQSLVYTLQQSDKSNFYIYLISAILPLIFVAPQLWRGIVGLGELAKKKLRGKGASEFVARQQMRRWNEDPNSIIRCFSVILWDWHSRGEIVGTLRIVEEANVADQRYYEETSTSPTVSPVFIDDEMRTFYHKDRPQILYKMWIERNSDNYGNCKDEILLSIEFTQSTNPTMFEHIEWLRTTYHQLITDKAQKQRVLMTVDKEASSEDKGPSFMVFEFHTTSTFDNFFSEEAALVYKDVQYFLKQPTMYTHTGRPWTYTVLNDGPPGVGKTKLVKALASLTGYTLIVVNLNHIQDTRALYDIFHNSVLAGEKVAHNKRLYYIPEVDTQTLDTLKERASTVEPCLVMNNTWERGERGERGEKDSGEGKEGKVSKLGPLQAALDKRPTLGEILNVLDGVPERHGHILVIDTNHLATLDAALIRPGRVDRIIRWQKMSTKNACAYLENYYSDKIPNGATIPDRAFTAAELGSLAAEHDSLKELLLALPKPSKKMIHRGATRLK